MAGTSTSASGGVGAWRPGAGMSRSALRASVSTGWLFIRLVLGIEWARAGWEKIGDPGWTADPEGAAVEGFLGGAIAKATAGEHPEVQHWFHDLAEDFFLPNADIFAYLVAYGELLVGVALIVGFLTRLSVLFGMAMNMAFLFAGTSSSNPQMLVLGFALFAVGAGAGEYGLDRWVLPALTRRVRPSIVDAGAMAAIVAAAGFAGWLAWITTDTGTWLYAAAFALIVGAVVATRVSGRKAG